jgi:hypothetical protein
VGSVGAAWCQLSDHHTRAAAAAVEGRAVQSAIAGCAGTALAAQFDLGMLSAWQVTAGDSYLKQHKPSAKGAHPPCSLKPEVSCFASLAACAGI